MQFRTRTILTVTGVALGVAILTLVVLLVLRPDVPTVAAPTPGPDYALPAKPPPAAAVATRKGSAGLADAAWVDRVSDASGIPTRALAAYAGVAIAKSQTMPGCGLGWTTLAAIGLIESDHGRHSGSSIGEDGTVRPPIFGIALDGSTSAHIPDTDKGAIDGDPNFDRAVGPMQLLPQTWRNWHVDGGGDGVEDPQNIDDAVAAAANYLCRASGDMTTRAGWRAAVGAYNSSDFYVQSVASAANGYAQDATSR